jgi:hypothetical protein
MGVNKNKNKNKTKTKARKLQPKKGFYHFSRVCLVFCEQPTIFSIEQKSVFMEAKK